MSPLASSAIGGRPCDHRLPPARLRSDVCCSNAHQRHLPTGHAARLGWQHVITQPCCVPSNLHVLLYQAGQSLHASRLPVKLHALLHQPTPPTFGACCTRPLRTVAAPSAAFMAGYFPAARFNRSNFWRLLQPTPADSGSSQPARPWWLATSLQLA